MLFSSLDVAFKSKVKLGDDYLVDVQGKGTTSILSKQNEKKDIQKVYYVQGLKHNMLSVRQFTQHGYEATFKGPTCTILDKPPNQ